MMPPIKYDFVAADKLNDILKHPRLQCSDEPGHQNHKRVTILFGDLSTYNVERNFLLLLQEKYGNCSFELAIGRWRDEKRSA